MIGRQIKGTRQHVVFDKGKIYIGYELTDLSSLQSWRVWKNIYKKSLQLQVLRLLKTRFKSNSEVKKSYRMDLGLYETRTWYGYKYELFGRKTTYSLFIRKGKTPARYMVSPYNFKTW